MAGRFSIEATFKALDQFSRPVARMSRQFERFTRSAARGVRELDRTTSAITRKFNGLGLAVGAAAATAGLAVREIVNVGAEFDKALVGAAARFDPTMKRGTEMFERLRIGAESFGETTEFNAQQGAEALNALASAGVKPLQALALLPGVGDLATTSVTDLSTAAERAVKSMGAFGLAAEDPTKLVQNLTRVSDVLSAAMNATTASAEGLYDTIRTGAPVATGLGASLEEFTALAAAMSAATIEGTVAGTTLKIAYQRLASPVHAASKALGELKIKTLDSSGSMRSMIDVIGDINKATAGMGTGVRAGYLKSIFGEEALGGIEVLLDAGPGKLSELRKMLEGAGGSTKLLAAALRDTVAGDLDELGSSIDGVKIALFSMNNVVLRDAIKSMTLFVRANKELIVSKVTDTIKFMADHLPEIASGLKAAGIAAGSWYAFAAGVKIAKTATEALELVTRYGPGVLNVFKGLAGLPRLIATAFSTITAIVAANPIGALIVATGAAVAALIYFWPEVSAFFDRVWKASEGARNAIMGHMRSLAQLFVDTWQPQLTFFAGIWNGIVASARFSFGMLSEIAGTVVEHWISVWSGLVGFFSSLWASITSGFDAAIKPIVDVIDTVGETISSVTRNAAGAFGDAFLGDSSEPERLPEMQVIGPEGSVRREIVELREQIMRSESRLVIEDRSGKARWEKPPPKGAGLRMKPSGAF